MANSPQARKRVRRSEKQRQRNMSHRSAMRTAIKKVHAAIQSGDYDAATAAFRSAQPVIDSMVSKGIIHRNKAARHKSQMNTQIHALKKSSDEAA